MRLQFESRNSPLYGEDDFGLGGVIGRGDPVLRNVLEVCHSGVDAINFKRTLSANSVP